MKVTCPLRRRQAVDFSFGKMDTRQEMDSHGNVVITEAETTTGESAEGVLNAIAYAGDRQAAFIADLFRPMKVADDRTGEIVACHSCSRCYGAIGQVDMKLSSPICRLNPQSVVLPEYQIFIRHNQSRKTED